MRSVLIIALGLVAAGVAVPQGGNIETRSKFDRPSTEKPPEVNKEAYESTLCATFKTCGTGRDTSGNPGIGTTSEPYRPPKEPYKPPVEPYQPPVEPYQPGPPTGGAVGGGGDGCTCVSKCTNGFEICCDGGPSSASTETVDQPQRVSSATGSPVMCGVRGKLQHYSRIRSGTEERTIGLRILDERGGDTSTQAGEFPWMVAVMKKNSAFQQEYLCAGSIIYPRIILTTAHNVRGYSAGDLVVKAGVWNSTDPKEITKHQDRSVSKIILHPGFKLQKINMENDIAVLVLDEPVTITDNVNTICLPSEKLPIDTSSCVATGWGGSANFGNQKNLSSELKKVNLPLVKYDKCQRRLRQVSRLGSNFNLHNSFICAGGDKVDTCFGDGGGPLMCATLQDRNRYVQVGVTSWGIGCGEGPPGVYASVEAAAEFIDTARAGVCSALQNNKRTRQ